MLFVLKTNGNILTIGDPFSKLLVGLSRNQNFDPESGPEQNSQKIFPESEIPAGYPEDSESERPRIRNSARKFGK